MRKMTNDRLIFILGGISLISLVVPIGIYIINFHKLDISTNPNDWADFGEFVGGVLSPLLSVANLIILGYITIFVSEQDSRIALNQFRYDIYLKLKEKSKILNRDTAREDISTIISDVEYFKGFDFLFEKKKEYIQKIESLGKILSDINQVASNLPANQKLRHLNAEQRTKVYDDIQKYEKAFENLIQFLQIEIVGR